VSQQKIRPADRPANQRAGWRLAVFLVALSLASFAALQENASGTPGVIMVAALIPPAGFAAVVLLLGRRASVPWLPSLGALFWGATAAPLAALALNDAALRALPHGLVTAMMGPLVEEVAKASALLVLILVWPGSLRSVREGIAYGALAGVGFAATENLGYYTLAAVQGGTSGLAQALYLRGLLEGLNHAAFTAIVGAAAGYARARSASRWPRRAIVSAGLGLAVAVHGVWNAVASTAITSLLCNAPAEGAACAPAPQPLDLLVCVPILIAAFIGPLAALLVTLALRDHRSS
jgi:RsiW-degrading membrane proteinase PrsW (M82 family)